MTATSPALLSALAAILNTQFRAGSEEELQEGLGQALTAAGIPFEREVILGPQDRIDFLVGDVGIELKVKGSVESAHRQLARYARHEKVQHLLLVTTKPSMGRAEYTIGTKRVRTLVLFRGLTS